MTGIPEPYKGLARFDDSELDERFFFGRDRETGLVAANLVASRLTVLYGPSGVGKSSLLRAGVARRLRALVPVGAGFDDADTALPVVVDQWRDDPLSAIAVAAGGEPVGSAEELADVLEARSDEIEAEIFLILDQIEEYLVYHGREKGGPLRDALAEILSRPALRVHVLLGIRDDALAELDAFKGRVPNLFGNVLRLDHLDTDAARAAILEPLAELEALGGPAVEAEPALVAAVVDQVASGRIERRLAGRGIVDGGARRRRVEAPYLQLVMQRVWEVERERGSSVLHAETLAELGGAGRIVQEHVERALSVLDGPEREVVARLFHQLVTPSGTKIAHSIGDLSRYAGETPERLEEILHVLAVERVVRALPGRNGGGSRYEIYHDVLADAVLDWGARHDAERALAEERAASRRRTRRLAVIALLALGAVGLTSILAAYAFAQRGEAERQAQRAALLQAKAEEEASLAKAARLESKKSEKQAKEDRAAATASAKTAKKALAAEALQADEARRQTRIAQAERDEQRRLRIVADDARDDAKRLAASEAEAKDDAIASENEAIASKNDALEKGKQLEAKGEALEVSEQNAVTARNRAQAGELVAEAISLLDVDPEYSLQLALRSSGIAAAPGLERTLREGLKAVRARAVLPSGSGIVEAVETIPAGASASALLSSGNATTDALQTSADGALVLVGGADGEVRVFEATGKRVARLVLDAELGDATFSPDGKFVFTGDANGVILRWDARTGARLDRFVHPAAIRDLAVSPDGRLVASAAGEGARVFLAADGTLVARLPHSFAVAGVAFSPSGAQLLTRANDVRLFDTGDWDRPAIVLDQPGTILTAAFSAVGDRVATGGRDDLAMIWDTRDGTRTLPLPLQHRGDVLDVAWSPNGGLLATASADNGGRVFQTDSGKLVTFLGHHSNQVVGVSFSPDGSAIVTASRDGSARVWSQDGFARSAALHGHSGEVLDAMFTRDGASVVTASDDGSVRVWKPAVDPILSTVGRHTAPGRAVSVAPDGRIATVGLDRTLRLWRRNGSTVQAIPLPAQAVDVTFSRDGSLLVVAGLDGVARVFGADGTPRQEFDHGAPLTSVAFDATAARVVTGGDDGIARVFSRAGGEPRELRHGGGAVNGVAFSPDGRLVATAGVNLEGRVWRASTGRLLGKLVGRHQDDLTAIAFSPDGKLIATASLDADANLWKASDLTWVRGLRGHSAVVSDVVFSPDGRWIATAGPTTVGLWQTVTGRRIDQNIPALFLRGHGPRVRSVAFFPDSRRVASIGDDGTVRTYLCELCGTAPQLAVRAGRLLERLGVNLTKKERDLYIGG